MSGQWARGVICFFGIILGVVSAACASGEHLLKDKEVLRLTAADAGREVKVAAGEQFEVALPEIPGGGYLWVVHKMDAEYLRLESEAYADPNPDQEKIGAGRVKVFTFLTLKAGETPLELWLRRPWEEPDKHEESFEVKIKIEAKS